MHYYQFNIGDYRRDTPHLSLLEHGVYRQLLDQYYLTERPINADDAKVMRSLCVRSADEMQALENVLADFFTRTEAGYIHKRCDIDIAEFHGKSESSRAAANVRWAKAREANHANALQSQSERYATAMPTINHKPLTINQEPVTTNTVESNEPKGSSPRASKKCPAGFVVSEELVTWAKTECPLADTTEETKTFRDYTFNRAITDWAGAWRNWIRKANTFAMEKQKPKAGTPKVYHALNNMNYEEGVTEDGTF